MKMNIKRLDHLGIISGVIKDLGLVEAIDMHLKKDIQDQEKITAGEAVAGMILNGLGFSDKPLSLTPHFFTTKAVDVLFREGVKAEYFNRHKLGKVLDSIHDYGCESLFYELSSQSMDQESVEMKFLSEDTTTFSLTGEYSSETDEHTIKVTHGYSKDHRPDLKQLVQELLVSQDGGIPLMMKTWDGNESDSVIFRERTNMLIEGFKQSESPRFLVADSKLYCKENAANLNQFNFITRIPRTSKQEKTAVSNALKENSWEVLNNENKYYVVPIRHYDMEQRWIVVYSDKARERAEKTLNKAIKKELDKTEKSLWHLSKQPYDCEKDAESFAIKLISKCHYHKLKSLKILSKNVYSDTGRPKKGTQPDAVKYYVIAEIGRDEATIVYALNEKSCYVIGTNTDDNLLTPIEVIQAYKNQNKSIENMGFRFLKAPSFFVSSLYLKKPSCIMGLMTIMTLALLIYSIAQRRIRISLNENSDTLPNQINEPTSSPTMRWVFQLMEGIHVVKVKVEDRVKIMIQGINAVKQKIIDLMSDSIKAIYHIGENVQFDLEGGSI